MWCNTCAQDVLGGSSTGDPRRLVCVQCGKALAPDGKARTVSARTSQRFRDPLAAIPLDWDDWELDDDVGLSQSLTQQPNATSEPSVAAVPSPAWDLTCEPKPSAAAEMKAAHSRRSRAITWVVPALSLAVFVGGAVLVGCSLRPEREDLWRWGLSLTVGGQAGWGIGMAMQLVGLRKNQRQTSHAVADLKDRVEELQRRSASSWGASQSFSAHWAAGAPPSLLLADVKGRLDLLAEQLSRQRAA